MYKKIMDKISSDNEEKIIELNKQDNNWLFGLFNKTEDMPKWANLYKGNKFYINVRYSTENKIKNILKVIHQIYPNENIDFKFYFKNKKIS